MLTLVETFFNGKKTEAAGTVIDILVPARKGLSPSITKLLYTSSTTGHTVTFMKPLGRTTLSANAAASQAVINLVADPGPSGNLIAANDFLVLENDDGSSVLHKVQSVAALAITLTANLAAAISAGKKVWFLGVAADQGTRTVTPTVSATTTYSDELAGFGGVGNGDPMVINSTNATAAGTFDYVLGGYFRGGNR